MSRQAPEGDPLTAAIFPSRPVQRDRALYLGQARVERSESASVKTFAISLALTMAALTLTPTAHADMQVGNYRLDTDRDPGHSWIWAIRPCTSQRTGMPSRIQAIPQPNGQAAPFFGDACLFNGRYTMTVDVPDGVRCVVLFFPPMMSIRGMRCHCRGQWSPLSTRVAAAHRAAPTLTPSRSRDGSRDHPCLPERRRPRLPRAPIRWPV